MLRSHAEKRSSLLIYRVCGARKAAGRACPLRMGLAEKANAATLIRAKSIRYVQFYRLERKIRKLRSSPPTMITSANANHE